MLVLSTRRSGLSTIFQAELGCGMWMEVTIPGLPPKKQGGRRPSIPVMNKVIKPSLDPQLGRPLPAIRSLTPGTGQLQSGGLSFQSSRKLADTRTGACFVAVYKLLTRRCSHRFPLRDVFFPGPKQASQPVCFLSHAGVFLNFGQKPFSPQSIHRPMNICILAWWCFRSQLLE
jgi:hypothetical protein